MSWVSIVNSSNRHASNPRLLVQYSDALKKAPKIKTDNIPRHKEIEADPADDFEMTNANKDSSYLEDLSTTHPYSLQCFIKWVHYVENESKLIDLNFDKIDKDLKLQYSLYKHQDVKKIYYNFDYDIYDFTCATYQKIRESNQHNKRYFAGHDSIVHYILKVPRPTSQYFGDSKTWNNKHNETKFVLQSAEILKLLVKNKIISTSEPIRVGTYGRSIYQRIGDVLMSMDKQFMPGDKAQKKCIDIYFELLIFCISERNKRTDIPEAALLDIYKMKGIDVRTVWSYKNMFAACSYSRYMTLETKSFISNKSKIIQRLLFRGIAPFSFCLDWNYDDDSQTKQCYDVDTAVFHKYFQELMSMQSDPDDINNITIFDKAVICSPLIMFPYLQEVKVEAFDILYECIQSLSYVNVFIKEIVDIILVHLYCGSKYDFYPKDFYENNELNIKVFEFFGYVGQVSMDENSVFDKVFNERYNNLAFAAYIIKNYSIEIITMFIRETNVNIEYLLKLFILCPPALSNYYYFLFAFAAHDSMRRGDEKSSELLIKFLTHAQQVYTDTFDINHIWYHDQIECNDHIYWINEGNPLIHNVIIKFVSECWDNDVGRCSLKVFKHILSHTDVNMKELLPFILTRRYKSANLISTLLKNKKYGNYSIEMICNEIIQWKSICRSKSLYSEEYRTFKKVLRKLISYLESRNKKDVTECQKELIEDTIDKLNLWGKKIKLRKDFT